ncbi:MAG TPA: hypothetical protein VFW40_12360 [Capsulimonadaceae bacterium]|nr:hypothetical protein [Capsulimonadaceae bacterium]
MKRPRFPAPVKRLPLILATAGLVGLIASAAIAQSALKLIINGSVASTNVRMIGGSAYVKLADVARALNMNIVPRAGGYEMVPAGGADQLQGKGRGKIGDTMFTGQFRFMVNGVQTLDSYTERYDQDRRDLAPKGPGDTLVVIDCRIKNGTNTKQEIVLSPTDWGENTALTDDQEHSYAPIDVDGHYDEGAPNGAWILPGAAIDFALVFSVPKGTNVKDLVFTIVKYSERGGHKGTDVRVSLTPQ